jgi:hypothetical protein
VVLAKVNFYFLKKHLLLKIRENREFSHTTVSFLSILGTRDDVRN